MLGLPPRRTLLARVSKRGRRWSSAAAFACAAFGPASAAAFCRSTTCSADCALSAAGCKTTGTPLFWPSACVGFSLQADGTNDLPGVDVRPVVEAAFVAWTGLACGGGPSTIAFTSAADAACSTPSAEPAGPNANVIMFQDDRWHFDGIDDNIAKTTVTFDPDTGEIWDADIELNSAYNVFTVGDANVDYDLQSILTHEIGHFIGLDHSSVPGATMAASYDEGTTAERTLSRDDIAGACAIYPADRDAVCDPTPRGGFSGDCAGASASSSGCALSARPGAQPPWFAILAAGAAALGARRRRPRRTVHALAAALLCCGLAAACSSAAPDGPTTFCDPGTTVFCRCFDNDIGLQTCLPDGSGEAACRRQSTGEVCNHFESTSSTGTPVTTQTSSTAASGGHGGGGGAHASSSSSSSSSAPSSSSSSSAGGGGAGGASSASSSAATGGGGAAPVATCPGTRVTVSMGTDTAVGGVTTSGVDDSSDRCGGSGASEIAYLVTPSSSGTLTVRATGVGATDPVLYARTGDCASGVSLGCADASGAGGVETLLLEAIAGTPLWIFVDTKPGAGGSFALSLHLDVGAPGDTCPGNPVAIAPGETITAGGDTSIAVAQYKGTGACALSGTKDIVYGVTPSADGTLTVTLTPSFDAQLYARSGSCTSSTTSTQLGCSDAPGAGAVERITFAVTGGTKYSVFVDGAIGSAGSYTIAFNLQ